MRERSFKRRDFLMTAAMVACATQLHSLPKSSIQVRLTVPPKAEGPQMPADFVGLSYEVQQLVDPTFFSSRNIGLVHAFKEISPHGVLRLGGNTSEFGYWKPAPDSPEPVHPAI